MNVSSSPSSKVGTSRALVVISGDSFFWAVWCIEYAISLQKEGVKVDILDLSRFRKSRYGYLVTEIKNRFLFRNSITRMLPVICAQNEISYIRKFPSGKYSDPISEMSIEEAKRFLSLLDGELAPKNGVRLKSILDVAPKVLSAFRSYYYQTKNLVSYLHNDRNYDLIATSNGRLVVGGAVVETALESGIDIKVIDSAISARWAYEIYSSKFLVNLQILTEEIRTTWARADSNRDAIAQIGLTNKLRGRKLQGPPWIHDFKSPPTNLNPTSGPLAVIFPTTDLEIPLHELTSDDATFGGSQERAFGVFCLQAKKLGYRIILRGHPHPGNEIRASMENRIWSDFCTKNEIDFIRSESGVNSYELMKKSDLNVSYYSTTAIDSIILRRPTLILGFTEFSPFLPEVCAYSSEQILNFLESKLPILDTERLYPWAYYQERGARGVENFEVDLEQKLSYRGKVLNRSRFKSFH